MSEAKTPPVPTPRKSKQKKPDSEAEEDVFVQSELPSVPSDEAQEEDTVKGLDFFPSRDVADDSLIEVPKSDPNEILYEMPNKSVNNDSGNENLENSQIYEEFCPGAAWQQELVAWLMAREFGSSLPPGTRPLPVSTERNDDVTDSNALSFMPQSLAQRASLLLSRLNTSSPTRLLVDVGQHEAPLGTGSAYSSLKKKKKSVTTVEPLTPMSELDRDFLSLFGVSPAQSDRRRSDSILLNSSSFSDSAQAPPDTVKIESTCVVVREEEENDQICEEFPVVSLRKNQPVRISVDRLDGSICWISANSEKSYKTVNSHPEMQRGQLIHRRMMASDVLRANVDVKNRHVVHLSTIPACQYAKESPFSYACSSPQMAVAMITCIAKTLDVYNSAILTCVNMGTHGGVICIGKIAFRQQSLQPWLHSLALITESRHLIILRPKLDSMASNGQAKPTVEQAIDLRYVRELRQESACEVDGGRLLYLRFGTSTNNLLYIRPNCACSSVPDCVCAAAGCDQCAAQFSAWQSILENLVCEASSSSRSLSEQRMSESDLPAIVDRILTHLTLSCLTNEGLHRQAGRVRVSNELLSAFRRDPWAVRFETTGKDGDLISAHDIVSTLKKFFHSLDCPLLLTGVDAEAESKLATAWIGAHYSRFGIEARLNEYRAAFGMLHPVARRTLQAMLLHLRTVAALEAQNRMNFLALAASWGPTLMCSHSDTECADNRRNESTLRLADVLPHGKSVVAGAIGVIIDLLSEMDSICPLETMPESVRRDAHVQDIAVRLHLQPQQHKQAGEITLQVEVDLTGVCRSKKTVSTTPTSQKEGALRSLNARRRSSHAVHVAPRLTAAELIKQLCTVDEGISDAFNDLAVWEYLAGGSLRRPLLPHIRLLDVCCSWASLEPEQLRRDCKFVIEAAPVNSENNSLYEMSDASADSEPIVSLKTSIPCLYSGAWTPETFGEHLVKLKHWLYLNEHDVIVKSMKSTPSALISATTGTEEGKSKGGASVARSGSSASTSTASGGASSRHHGSFRSFFSTALSHINAHRLASNGRLKFSTTLSEINAVYAAHRSIGLPGSGTSGLVISCRTRHNNSPDEQVLKHSLHSIHVLNEQVRDRLISYFYLSLLTADSVGGKINTK